MSHIDTSTLQKAINHFKYVSNPSNGNSSEPCNIGDIRKVVNEMAKLMETFVKEIEKIQ